MSKGIEEAMEGSPNKINDSRLHFFSDALSYRSPLRAKFADFINIKKVNSGRHFPQIEREVHTPLMYRSEKKILDRTPIKLFRHKTRNNMEVDNLLHTHQDTPKTYRSGCYYQSVFELK